jgi:membrane-associated phospholipid phosphatase
MKRFSLSSLIICASLTAAAQQLPVKYALYKTIVEKEPVYTLKPVVDIPLTAAAAGFTVYGFSKIYSKEASTLQQIQNLKKEDINGFDRWAAGLHSQKAADVSDLFFYGAMPLPLLLLADKDIRSDGFKITFLYLQAMSLTGVLYTGVPSLVDRYRPLTYSNAVPMEERVSGNNRNSFFAGHVALVGTSTFFAAKVFSDYHPDSKLRHVFWGAAAVATATTGYLRHRGGKHFPSDIVVGAAIGTLSGILVPHFHKKPLFKNQSLTVLPFSGKSHGLAAVYRFN